MFVVSVAGRDGQGNEHGPRVAEMIKLSEINKPGGLS